MFCFCSTFGLSSSGLKDDQLLALIPVLRSAPLLATLSLAHNALTDKSLRALALLKSLTSLNLSGTLPLYNVQSNLIWLKTPLTCTHAAAVLQESSLDAVFTNCPGLQHLFLPYCSSITAHTMSQITTRLPELRTLDLQFYNRFAYLAFIVFVCFCEKRKLTGLVLSQWYVRPRAVGC
jgi:hypothetical protein